MAEGKSCDNLRQRQNVGMGTNWEAIAAVGQVAGAVGTAAAFGAAIWLLTVERRRDAAADKMALRAQAERVAAWPSEVRDDFTNPDSIRNWGTAIRNGSDLPVHQVHVVLHSVKALNRGEVILEVVPPGDWLLSGSDLYPRPESPEIRSDSRHLPFRDFTVSLQFTDAAGRKWRRTEHGYLQSLNLPVDQ
jgi:hypothetical protein